MVGEEEEGEEEEQKKEKEEAEDTNTIRAYLGSGFVVQRGGPGEEALAHGEVVEQRALHAHVQRRQVAARH